jgi:chromosome segregation ATPase
MSDTPRTKAATRMAFTSEYMVEIEEAEKLERELAQSKEANAGLMRACDNLERELADMTKQRDALAEALEECLEDSQELLSERGWWKDESRCGYKKCYEELLARIEKTKQTLAAVKGGSHE